MTHEIIRVTTAVNRGLSHYATKDVEIVVPPEISASGKEEKYFVKKGARFPFSFFGCAIAHPCGIY